MRLVMFDMDGTLIDTQALIAEQVSGAFTSLGLVSPTPAEARTVIGLSLPIALGRLANTSDIDLIEGLVGQYKSLYKTALEDDLDREPLYPGARAAIDRLLAMPDTQLGIATGKGLSGAVRILGKHGISGHFVTLQTPDHNPSKPHPGMLLRAMAETGATAAETVMIGDTTFDIELAVAAGVAAIGVTWGYHEADTLLKAGAATLIDSYDELDEAIARVLE